MGEAKRRREWARDHDPIAATHRAYGHRGIIPAEEFRVPDGALAVTFDVTGTAASTAVIDPANLVDVLATASAIFGHELYHHLVRAIAAEFRDARQPKDSKAMYGIVIAAVWTAMNHPQNGEAIRNGVARAMRETNRAHLTWHFNAKHGLAIALAGRYLDLETLLAAAPPNIPFRYVADVEPEPALS